MTATLNKLIKAPVAQTFRRAQIKRRNTSTGLFESSWLDISKDVKSYGKITAQIDAALRHKFTFGNAKLIMENISGRYNPHDIPTSHWYGYLNQQRTLVQIQAGFLYPQQDGDGIWTTNEFPSQSLWDVAIWDADASVWDNTLSSSVFTGIISGDLLLSDKNEVTMNLRSLISVFQDFPAANLTGWTTTGMTASQFVTMVRDQVDTNGNYVFLPFFGNSVGGFDISSTSNVYTNLISGSVDGVADASVWDVVQVLAQAENFLPFVTREGVFKFISRDSVAATPVFEFHGVGSFSGAYGHTIKAVNSYGFKVSKFYSRVQVKWVDSNTTSAFEIQVAQGPLTVAGNNNPWVLGVRTLEIENYFIPNAAFALSLATTIFNDTSALKKEIEFTTSFIPHLDILDRFSMYYDPAPFDAHSLWDLNNWADDAVSTDQDLIWDNSDGDAIILDGQEFKFLSLEIDLDHFQNKFLAREV